MNNNIKKVIWLSRHEMTDKQRIDLENTLRVKDSNVQINITTINHIWQCTTSISDDMCQNVISWSKFLRDYDVICGVFPPVALESKPNRIEIYTPVSAQTKEERADGEAKIVFKHLRWAII